MVNQNWQKAKKALQTIGVGVYRLPSTCCYGCVDNSPVADNEPALYYFGRDFSGNKGGYLCHQNIESEEMAGKVMYALNSNGISYKWDGSPYRKIEIVVESECV